MAKIAIVTGSDSGIGKATAVLLAQAGYDVGVTFNSDEDGARDTAREVESHSRRAVVRQLDLSKLPQAADVVDDLAEELGGVEVLVNNAGMSVRKPFFERDWDGWREPLAVDLDGAFLCGQRAARRMVEQRRGG